MGTIMERRSFLDTVGRIAVGGFVALPLLEALGGCSTITQISASPTDGTVVVPMSAFGTAPDLKPIVLVNVAGVKHPIAVVRSDNEPAIALYVVCTHKHCSLDVEQNGFSCPCHGSTFDMTGAVTNGPAKQPLKALTCTTTADAYVITLGDVS